MIESEKEKYRYRRGGGKVMKDVKKSTHQVHQGLDEQSHGIAGGLDCFDGALMRTVPQVYAIHFDYPVASLKTTAHEKTLNNKALLLSLLPIYRLNYI